MEEYLEQSEEQPVKYPPVQWVGIIAYFLMWPSYSPFVPREYYVVKGSVLLFQVFCCAVFVCVSMRELSNMKIGILGDLMRKYPSRMRVYYFINIIIYTVSLFWGKHDLFLSLFGVVVVVPFWILLDRLLAKNIFK